MLRLLGVIFVLMSATATAQEAEDWPPPPGPICGEIESGVEADFRFHELQLTAENYRQDMDAMNSHVRRWIYQNSEAGREAFSWEVQMAWHNNMTAIHLYVLRLEAMSAEGEDQQLAIDRFCDALSSAFIMD
ncbi:hypothetical protein HXX25_07130 [Hyphobacterium sp. CCMP332]|uniref:hypothetical protein n=1 Tax=Hyphobacterium sp. CCMP332 TaxID=2749086 RepID=UPI00164EF2A0|nr:hypothetical protein [Hyphobacterium sp. CCMP332]QNL19098.1 hypothetical protein HXX25_07130 [Hyphobacterium sp. CCMP332]